MTPLSFITWHQLTVMVLTLLLQHIWLKTTDHNDLSSRHLILAFLATTLFSALPTEVEFKAKERSSADRSVKARG